jgi:hypothetical protein
MESAVKDEYRDNWVDRLFIGLFSRKMAIALGKTTALRGYDGFVDLSQKIMQGRNATQQKEVVTVFPVRSCGSFEPFLLPRNWSASLMHGLQRFCSNGWLALARRSQLKLLTQTVNCASKRAECTSRNVAIWSRAAA